MVFVVAVKVPEAGSNSSAVFNDAPLPVLPPPARRTLPFGRSVAEYPWRAEVMVLDVAVNDPLANVDVALVLMKIAAAKKKLRNAAR